MMSGGMMSGGMMSGGMMSGGMGSGGMGYPGMGGPSGGAASALNTESPYDASVEIYGIIYIYNPVDPAKLGIEQDDKADAAADAAGGAAPHPTTESSAEVVTGSAEHPPTERPPVQKQQPPAADGATDAAGMAMKVQHHQLRTEHRPPTRRPRRQLRASRPCQRTIALPRPCARGWRRRMIVALFEFEIEFEPE